MHPADARLRLGGYELVMRAYRESMGRGYRFYSYGDATLLV